MSSVRERQYLPVLLVPAGVVVGIRDAWRARSYNRDVFPQALSRWRRSWLCASCGERFEATE
jgi:hypothetical protein